MTEELRRGELVRIRYGWTPNSLAFAARYDNERSATYVTHAAAIASEISHAYRLELENLEH